MASLLTCRVHPVVMFSIIDAYERRGETKDGAVDKVIGTLLGTYEKGVIEVTNCYVVPHSEINDDTQIHAHFNKDSYDLHKRANSLELPVGWFSTQSELHESSIVYHSYYQKFIVTCMQTREQMPIVFLTLDTALSQGKMNPKAYLRIHAGIPKAEREQCTIFMPLEVEVVMSVPEQVAVDLMMTTRNVSTRQTQLITGGEQINQVTDQMMAWIKQIQKYVNDVKNNKVQPDTVVGRRLMELVSSVTQIQPKQFQNMLNSTKKDYLMVVYLSQLAKTQLTLNEKLIARTA